MDQAKQQLCNRLDRDLGSILAAVYEDDKDEAALRLKAFARMVKQLLDCEVDQKSCGQPVLRGRQPTARTTDPA